MHSNAQYIHPMALKNISLSVITYVYSGHRSARGVIVIVVGNRHGDTSSNPGRDWLHFT